MKKNGPKGFVLWFDILHWTTVVLPSDQIGDLLKAVDAYARNNGEAPPDTFTEDQKTLFDDWANRIDEALSNYNTEAKRRAWGGYLSTIPGYAATKNEPERREEMQKQNAFEAWIAAGQPITYDGHTLAEIIKEKKPKTEAEAKADRNIEEAHRLLEDLREK